MELFLIVAAIAAAFGGAAYARLQRARADLADVLTRIDVLNKAIRAHTGRLLLIVGGLSVLLWVVSQGGTQ